MQEALWVLGAVVLLVVAGTVTVVLPPETLVVIGFAAIALGNLAGVPAGVWYHVLLRRQLLRKGPLPARWWLHPVRHHDELSEEEQRPFLRWFYAGAAGFALVLAGAVTLGLGLMRWKG